MDKIFKNILDFISEGIIYQEASGEIKVWNKAAEAIFSLSAQRAGGLTSTSHNWNLIYEDGTPCPDDQHPSMLTLETGKSYTNEIRGIQHAGGGITWLSINTRPVFETGEYKPSAVVIFFLDVTDRISARHDLREVENQYAMAAKMAKVGHWMRDFENDKAEWSPEVFHIFGLDPAKKAPSQKEFFEKIVHPEDRAHLLSSIQRSLAEMKNLDCQYRIVQTNGEIRHIHAMAEIEENEDSVPARLVGFLQDVTDLRRAEDELQKSYALLSETQALTKVGGWDLDVVSGEVQWTDEVYRIYGVKPGEYDPRDISRDLSFYDPESLPILEEAFERALNQGIPYDLELKFIRTNGERIWVRTLGKPLAIDGKVTRLAGNFMDITERKILEEKLRNTLTLLENVYASLDEVVFVVDPATRKIISCNAAVQRVFGYQPDDLVGKNTELIHVNKKMYREFGKQFLKAMDDNGIFHIEYALKRKDGTVLPTEHTMKEIKDSSGKRILVISVVRDISAQKQALEDLNRHKEDLFNKNKELEELNIALRVLLDQREAERQRLEESFADSINSAIIPYLDKIRKTSLSTIQEEYLGFLETSLREAIRPYAHRISDKLMRLSPSETIVANCIKRGLRSKEIAAQLSVSTKTVEFHRSSIRKKLGLKGRKINLKTYLASLNYY